MAEFELPEGWVNTNLEFASELITKGTTPTTIGYSFQHEGIPFVKIENIEEQGINLDSVIQFISQETHDNLKRSQLQIGDILFSIAGTIGKSALVCQNHIPANTNQAIAIIRGTQSLYSSDFLRQYLRRSAKIIAFTHSRGGAMNNISLGDLKQIQIPLPPPRRTNRNRRPRRSPLCLC